MTTNDQSIAPQTQRTFEVKGPIDATVLTASGDLEVMASSGDELVVTLRTDAADPERRLAEVEVDFDSNSGRLRIDTKSKNSRDGGLTAMLGRWRDAGRNDVNVRIEMPPGSALSFKTASGDLVARCPLASLEMASASGDAVVGDVNGATSLNTASGDLMVERARGPLTMKSASGDCVVRDAVGDLKIQSVSGDAVVHMKGEGQLRVSTVSGDTELYVPAGYVIDIDAQSVAGDLTSDIDLDGPGEGPSNGHISVHARSVSGDVSVRRS